MHRFYLPPAATGAAMLALEGGEAHHALHVLRVREGERVVVLDGAGHEISCEVEQSGRDQVNLRVLERRRVARTPYEITLLQALPKGKLFESIIQKGTELGVSRIVPVLSERVVARIDEEEGQTKSAKWQAVAIEAIKQCGSPWLPKIEAPLSPDKFLARQEKFELALVGSLQNGSRHPREYFQAFQQQHKRSAESVAVWIGPEGDFTPAELDSIQRAGAQPITLGRQVLRTETAAIYCLSIIHYELQWR